MGRFGNMRAMVLEQPRSALVLKELAVPKPAAGQALIKVLTCGICRTDLHVVDGELTEPKLPLIPGHEIIGRVEGTGSQVEGLAKGDLVGVPWLGYTCGHCKYCKGGRENLCANARFTGYTIDGGYAEYTVADARFCFKLDDKYANARSTPLMCAGLIGFRSYNMIEKSAKNIGFYGFGAAAHILVQLADAQGKKIFAFTRDGDTEAQRFALKMGAAWAGDSSKPAPEPLDAAIIFAAAGQLVPKALKDVDKGGQIICGGIHMSDIPSFPYDILWGERMVKSVANLTRDDGVQFFKALQNIDIKTEVKLFKLEQANEALQQFRDGKFSGAAVLVMDEKI